MSAVAVLFHFCDFQPALNVQFYTVAACNKHVEETSFVCKCAFLNQFVLKLDSRTDSEDAVVYFVFTKYVFRQH